MAIESIAKLKTYFETKDKPTEAQFSALIESMQVGTTGTQLDIKSNKQIIPDKFIKIISSYSGEGNIPITTKPQISQGVDGQQLILIGNDDINYITLRNGDGIILNSSLYELKKYKAIFLVFNIIIGNWIEVNRSGISNQLILNELPEKINVENSDWILISDSSGLENKKITRANFLSGIIGGSSNLTIQDEGVEVSTGVKTLNFSGINVEAIGNGETVTIYIPPPDYLSHFNTNDGTNEAFVDDIETYLRNVALPTSEGNPYKIGDWTSGTLRDVINTTSIIYSTNDFFSILNNLNTTLTVNVYDANDYTIKKSNILTITGNFIQVENDITIQILDFSTDKNKFKAKLIVTINIGNIFPTGGRFNIDIIHNNGTDGIFTKSQGPIFYDPNIFPAVLNNISINETVGQVITKRLSGVSYYDLNSKFSVNIADIDFLNDRSYPNIQVNIDGSLYGLPFLELSGSNLSNWNNYFSSVNNYYNKTDWSINNINYFIKTNNANIYTRTIDWTNSDWIYSINKSILVDTFQNNNSPVYEDFRNEIKRLKSDLINYWDSNEFLYSYDDLLGLQVQGSKLIYPTENFTLYNPLINQPDYSTLTGFRKYRSRFFHTGVSHSNGIFRFTEHNIIEDDLTNYNVLIRISLDGINWYILNDLYIGGVLGNNSGCRINKDSYNISLNNQIEFTLGTGGFTDTLTGLGWGIFYEISYNDNVIGKSKFLGSFEIINWI